MQDNVETKRSRKKIVDDGCMFTFERDSRDGLKKFWRCERRTEYCHARLHTDDTGSTILQRLNGHNHGSNPANVEVARIKTAIKRRAVETLELPGEILNTAIGNACDAVKAQMPNADAIRKIVQRKRNAIAAAPPAPLDLATLVIPDGYRFYENGPGEQELFLLRNVQFGANQRILIFGRESYSAWSDQMDNVFMDGTFSIAPPLFSQVYLVLAKRGGFVFPVLYALLPNKQRETYDQLFANVKQIWPNFNPLTISVDFENAAVHSLRNAFPDSRLFGCFYHLTSNLRKKLMEEGLIARCNNDPEFSLQARMVIALAFVPIISLEEVFEALSGQLPGELLPVLHWFEDNYMGRPARHGPRHPALFPVDLWSVNERVLNDEDRTNNYCEAGNRRLNSELGMSHPTIWKFISALKKVQKGRDIVYQQYVRGDQPPKKRQQYVVADARIKNLVQNFNARDAIEFLRGIGHNYLID